MSLITDIKKIAPEQLILSGWIFIAVLSPGVLIIYYFRPSVFFNVDVLKLILLSSSFTIPLYYVNTILVGWAKFLTSDSECIEIGNSTLSLAACASFFLFSLGILFAMHFHWSLSKFISNVISMELGAIGAVFILYQIMIRKKKKKDANTETENKRLKSKN